MNIVYQALTLIFQAPGNEGHDRYPHMPTLHSGHYRAKKQSLVALWGKPFLFGGNCSDHAFSLSSLSRKSRKGRSTFVIDRDLAKELPNMKFFSKQRKQIASSFHLRCTEVLYTFK